MSALIFLCFCCLHLMVWVPASQIDAVMYVRPGLIPTFAMCCWSLCLWVSWLGSTSACSPLLQPSLLHVSDLAWLSELLWDKFQSKPVTTACCEACPNLDRDLVCPHLNTIYTPCRTFCVSLPWVRCAPYCNISTLLSYMNGRWSDRFLHERKQ